LQWSAEIWDRKNDLGNPEMPETDFYIDGISDRYRFKGVWTANQLHGQLKLGSKGHKEDWLYHAESEEKCKQLIIQDITNFLVGVNQWEINTFSVELVD
jgi:hypothetical protein